MNVRWTREAIEALGPTTDVDTAASVLSISEWLGYELIRRGEWPTRVLRLGRRIRIPTHDLVVLLYAPETSEAGPGSPAIAHVQEDTTDDTVPRALRAAR